MAVRWLLLALFALHAAALPDLIRIGGLFHPADDKQAVAFRYAVEKINGNRDILPRSRLSAQIEQISPQDSFHASKRGGKYDTELIDDAYKVRMKLTIRSVTENDYGAYLCVSRNSLGDTDGSIKLYKVMPGSHYSYTNATKYKGKLKKTTGNDILEGNQDMLKERDLKLRGRKDNGEIESDEDYEDSNTSRSGSSDNPTLVIVALASLLYLRYHRPHLLSLRPA